VDRTTIRRAAIVAGTLVLAWRIIAVNAVSYDITGRPVGPGDGTVGDLTARVQENPGDVYALVSLARNEARRGDVSRAGSQLAAAAGLAPVEPIVLEADAESLFVRGQVAQGAARLSQLATIHGNYDRWFPVFSRLLAARDPALQRIAAGNPKWLGAFILDQCAKGADAMLLAPLLDFRGSAKARAQPAEIECVTERLRGAGRWREAYQVWLNALPRERLASVGFVFNGSFEYPASGVGFDWKPDAAPERNSGHAVEHAPSREGRGDRALRVTYTGKRQVSPAVVQYLSVPPGRYELSGWARVDHLNSPRGVQWIVRCASDENAVVIGASERFLGSSEWRRFSLDVDIPSRCAGQALQLEPVGMAQGTTFLTGTLWFDDLSLSLRR
jgi:hypothetical protein